ncbi:hypothetical protein GCM10009640_13990 [Agrococcus citreus]|uniref:Uncharacterized protein n=1 Tax=Agrococcus citreus TaxID=84643 RepID=A0ABP4JHJ2_9MICO
MASVGRDAAVEAAVAALPGVLAVEAAVVVDGFPGRRSARVHVTVADGDGADAVGAVARAALDALRAGHGPAIRTSLAIVVDGADGVRRPIEARAVIAAAALDGAAAAGDEVLLGAQTRQAGGA